MNTRQIKAQAQAAPEQAPAQPAAAITCSMCGHRFDPAQHVACKACPLHSGCLLVCCPACGFELVNTDRSSAARWIKRLLQKNG